MVLCIRYVVLYKKGGEAIIRARKGESY